MSAIGVTVSTEPVVDPATPAAGAQGDANKATIPTTPAPAASGDTRPTWLPEKFKSAEDMAKAYGELEKKLGAPKAEPTPAATVQPAEQLAKAGLDMAAIAKEYAENNGTLSDKTNADLAAKGISRETVSTFVDGLKAQAAQMRSGLAEAAGGEEGLKSVYEWATANMSADEVQAYNAVIESGNMAAAKLALQGIVTRFTQATGSDPKLVGGERTPSGHSDIQPFESNGQVIEAMRDPRYANDDAYRAKVEKRMAKTNLFSIRG